VFLVFDAYGTLVELDDFYGRLQRGFSQRGANLSLDVVTRSAHREMRHYIAQAVHASDATSHAVLHRECGQIIFDALSEQAPTFALDLDAVEDVLRESVVFRAFSETHATLEKLAARGIEMGIASNWDYSLAQHLETLGIAHYFRFVLSSANLGVEKPAPEFFDAVRSAVGNTPATYIGDHYEKDVLPSRAAGFDALWLVREERDLPSGETSQADGIVPLRSLEDIFTRLRL
jgi:HAD superfamily hydrolase (TIGR01549 family)